MLAASLVGDELAPWLDVPAQQQTEPADDPRAAALWAASGAMWLTGRADGPPLRGPSMLGPRLTTVGRWLDLPELDVMALLGERAAITGMYRNGRTSVGGRCQLIRARDEWIAVSLARPEDHDALPAWLGIEPSPDLWGDVERAVADRTAAEVIEQGVLLGLPLSRLGEYTIAGPAVTAKRLRAAGQASSASALVVDLSSLWAGPLCAHLLGLGGARVIKVESVHRPDGARRGPRAFYDLLHAGHESIVVDFRTEQGVAELRELIAHADVVIEGSRQRALEQLGIVAAEVIAAAQTGTTGGPSVWLSITAYGRGVGRDRVGFGDDVAVAGGLVAWEDGEPRFCADAIADPLTGIVGAAVTRAALRAGGGWLIDLPLAAVARWMSAGEPRDGTAWDGPVARPRARQARGG